MDEILEHLKQFDRERGWNNYELAKTSKEKREILYKEIVNMLGEFGELANEVKKGSRDNTWEIEKLREEMADTFIFFLKISFILEMDIKKEYFKKMKQNEERFKVKK